ncbi:ubiquitin carboxyl-terminal hydrolase [Xylariaceae sp. FL0594]|nr:ubiquitin carboxyl-terminal hydrolase [Xylariaceae sp. FL0594]
MSGGWNTIESDAGVFTFLLNNLGVKDVQFEELLTLEPEALEALHPVYGVIFLFKYPTDGEAPYAATDKPLDGTFDREAAERIFFAAQTIQNACGTQALLSVLLNKDKEQNNDGSGIDIGQALREFRDFTMVLPPEFRGEALSNSELIRDVHNSFAKSSPFIDETTRDRRDASDAEDAFHFIAYTAIQGTLYELDGLQPAPISHGPCSEQDFPRKVMDVLQRRVQRYDMSEIRFNLMAMVRDLRVRAREIGDEEAFEREQAKRRDWQFENALRRHNFVGFAGKVLEGVVRQKLSEGDGGGEDKYRKWVADATAAFQKRLESRRKGGAAAVTGAGGEDVEMEG